MKDVKAVVYSVYRITNKVNGKIYIGRTKNCLLKRFSVHKAYALYGHRYLCRGRKTSGCRYLTNAMRKYGIENFTIETLEICPTFEDMKKREGELIRQYDSCNPLIGYNLKYDTLDGKEFLSEETKLKMFTSSRASRFSKGKGSIGVFYSNDDGKHGKSPWMVRIKKGSEIFCRRFSDKEKAVEWYDKISLYLHGPETPINREEKREEYLKSNLAKLVRQHRENKALRDDRYYQISFCRSSNNYQAHLGEMFLGEYKTEDEAAELRDRIIIHSKSEEELNFPDKLAFYKTLENETAKIYELYSNKNKVKRHNKCGIHNVYSHSKNGGWGYDCRFNGERQLKFGFKTKETAGLARDIVALDKLGYSDKIKLNFPVASIFLFELSGKDDMLERLKQVNPVVEHVEHS